MALDPTEGDEHISKMCHWCSLVSECSSFIIKFEMLSIAVLSNSNANLSALIINYFESAEQLCIVVLTQGTVLLRQG